MVSQLQEWGTEVCWICILDCVDSFMCAFVQSTKTFKPEEFYLSRIFNGKKRAIFGKIPQINSQKNFYDKTQSTRTDGSKNY